MRQVRRKSAVMVLLFALTVITTAIAFAALYYRVPPGLPPLPEDRSECSAITLNDGRTLIIGGFVFTPGLEGQIEPAIARAEIYDPRTGSYSSAGDMAVPRCRPSATLLQNGQVLILGGGYCVFPPQAYRGHSTPVFKAAEVFDPAKHAFKRVGDMDTGRLYPALVTLKNSKILVIGGQPGLSCGALKTTDLYDPATATFSPSGNLQFSRANAHAELLNDGKVLVSGGSADPCPAEYGSSVTQRELYDPATGNVHGL
jgi:hypothetical protein